MTVAIQHHRPSETSLQIHTLDEAIRYAQSMACAGMVPNHFQNNAPNILVAREIAVTLGESTWNVMSEISFVGGRPSFSAKFFRSRVRQAGHKLREYYDPKTMTAKAVIIRHDDPDHEHVAVWDMAKAEKHGLGKKNHWLKNPELMLKNRAVSEVVREACYEVMGGIAYTPDEVQDFTPEPVRHTATRQQQQPQQQPRPEQAAERTNAAMNAITQTMGPVTTVQSPVHDAEVVTPAAEPTQAEPTAQPAAQRAPQLDVEGYPVNISTGDAQEDLRLTQTIDQIRTVATDDELQGIYNSLGNTFGPNHSPALIQALTVRQQQIMAPQNA